MYTASLPCEEEEKFLEKPRAEISSIEGDHLQKSSASLLKCPVDSRTNGTTLAYSAPEQVAIFFAASLLAAGLIDRYVNVTRDIGKALRKILLSNRQTVVCLKVRYLLFNRQLDEWNRLSNRSHELF